MYICIRCNDGNVSFLVDSSQAKAICTMLQGQLPGAALLAEVWRARGPSGLFASWIALPATTATVIRTPGMWKCCKLIRVEG